MIRTHKQRLAIQNRLGAYIKLSVGQQIYDRFTQLADEAAKESAASDYLREVVNGMIDVLETWKESDWDMELKSATQAMPKLGSALVEYYCVTYEILNERAVPSVPEADRLAKNFLKNVYRDCAIHFGRYPVLVCSAPDQDPAGDIAKRGEAFVEKTTNNRLRLLVPVPSLVPVAPAEPAIPTVAAQPVAVAEPESKPAPTHSVAAPKEEGARDIPLRSRRILRQGPPAWETY